MTVTTFNLGLDLLTQRTSMKWTRYPADVLPVWVAEMDVAVPPGVRAALEHAIEIGDFGYHGTEVLQPAFVRYAADTWGQAIDQHQVTACADVVSGMAALVSHFTPADATIAITTPIYPPFRKVAGVDGREVLEVPMTEEGRLDLAAIEYAFSTAKPAAFLLCNPHNPYGTIPTRDELTAIAALAGEHDVIVISDEIHAGLVAPGETFVPYLSVEGAQRGFTAVSASKMFNLAALKAGLLVAGTEVVDDLWSLPYEVRSGASHLGLITQAAGLDHDREWLAGLNADIAANKDLLADLLSVHLGLHHVPSPATYLSWVDCTPLGLDRPAARFLSRGRVAFNPGTDYASDAAQWVRVNVATSPEILTEAVRRMAASLD